MYTLLRIPSPATFRRSFWPSNMIVNPSMFNVIQLGIGFFFIFFAFNAQSFIEEPVVGKYDGYTSLAIIYFSFTASNLIAAPIVAFLKARWSMVFGAATYALFQMGFLFLNTPYLLISSAILGLGAAVIWTAQGKYLTLNSTEGTASKNSGVFWAISQACIIAGGVFLFVVLRGKDTYDNTTIRVLYGVFTVVTVCGTVILALLRMPLANATSDSEMLEEDIPLNFKQALVSTIKLVATKRVLVMVMVFAYTGVELAFWSSIYANTINNTKRLGMNTKTLTALNALALGFGQAISGFLFGILSSKTSKLGRDRIVLLGAVIHLIVYIAVYINFPVKAPLGETDEKGIIEPNVVLALICGFLLGFGDACWNTQIFSFLITKYSSKSAQAFSIFKFFQSLVTCIIFFCSRVLNLHWHLLILVIGVLVGSVCFCIAERMPSDDEDSEVSHTD
ncbi:ion channel regulatory protein UNC-93 domain-containing protein [Ditylenchus destructor]|uniref:UNC93-like protein MFSD11 n=1 Tax=Ditylenchus destructor TaxID=166010 RepID=A0AAD4MVS2_9BILA|nr:ion channel regulatory protein UNC-93 domain-containing protein [Ditylenchus destructor]